MRQNGALIRKFAQDELYDGMLVVSMGNLDTIYELRGVRKDLEHRAAYRIERRPGTLVATPLTAGWQRNADVNGSFTEFWETEWTKKLDRAKIRERRLKELGI